MFIVRWGCVKAVLLLLAQQGRALSPQAAVFLFDGMERHEPPHNQQQNQSDQGAEHHPGHIDPDVGHLGGSVRDEALDRLIQQSSGHAAKQRPADMAHETVGIHPQAEHEQEAFEGKLGKMGKLADGVLGQRAEVDDREDLVDFLHNGLTPGRGESPRFQRIAEDKGNAGDEGDGEDNPEGNEPGACLFMFHYESSLVWPRGVTGPGWRMAPAGCETAPTVS